MFLDKPTILECTLRDGSYVNNFQFTKYDTANILSNLEKIGFKFIEVGHGMGLGASELGGKLVAAETDEVYLKTASEVAKSVMWGMFCIPGIATLEHLSLAEKYGMKFIRIGANIEDYHKLKPFVEKAKSCGFYTCANLMKSYTVSPKEFANCAFKIKDFGVDLLYIVDSAGGMLPDELAHYIRATKDKCPDLDLGFHGHNNLGLGVANSLIAIENGVKIVDTTLQGFGRSAGNAPTEQLIACLLRKGISLGIDPIKVVELSETCIQPLIERKGLSALDVISGMALFHSSYMPLIKEYSLKYNINPCHLIVAVCKYNQVETPEELVEEQAKKLAEQGLAGDWKVLYKHYIGGEQNV